MSAYLRRLSLAAALYGSLFGYAAAEEFSLSANSAPPAAAAPVQAPPTNLKEAYKQALPSVCWIRGQADANGQFTMGTGWVLDAEKRLIVTNEHVVTTSETVSINFPETANGRLIVEPSHYTSGDRAIAGTVVVVDKVRDLAIVQVDRLPDNAKSATLAAEDPENGDQLMTIAGLPEGSEGLWVMTVGHVRLSYRRSHANGAACRVVETDMPANRGNSGGAVFNQRGEVVSVFEGFSKTARLVTMTIAASEVRDLISENGGLLSPVTSDDFHARGEHHRAFNRNTLAAHDLAQAIKLDPRNAGAIAAQGWLFFDKSDFRTAQSAFEKALQLDGDNVLAFNGLGSVMCEIKKYDESLELLTEAIRRAPDDAQLYRNRAVTFDWMDNAQAAADDVTRAIQLNPSEVEYYQLRAGYYRRVNQSALAIQDFVKVLQANPNDAEQWLNAAFALQEAGQHGEAIAAFSKTLELNKDQHAAFSGRGNSYYQLSKYQEATADFAVALQLNPSEMHYHNSMGNTLFELQRYADAISFYDAAIKLTPSDAQLYRNRALAYEQLGNAQASQLDNRRAQLVEAQASK